MSDNMTEEEEQGFVSGETGAVDPGDERFLGIDPIYQNDAYYEPYEAEEVEYDDDDPDKPFGNPAVIYDRVKEMEAANSTEVEDVVVEDDAFDTFRAEEGVNAMNRRATEARNADVPRGDAPAGGSNDDEGYDEAPSRSASKADWVDWSVSQGADRADAEASTKDDLIATYG